MALQSTPQLRIMHALAESRRCRHHKECHCHMFDHLFCGDTTSTKFEWANISGEYRIDRDDWARLCCRCHRRYDFGVKNRIELSL